MVSILQISKCEKEKCIVPEEVQMMQSRQSGFTLIEVMIAVMVLTIGILAVVSNQYTVINGTTNGNVVTQEVNLAQRYMEQYKNAQDPTTLTNQNIVGVDFQGQPGGPYNVAIRVSNPLSSTASRFVSVQVTKSGGIGGHPLTITSTTTGNGI